MYRVAILTASDKGAAGLREDVSGAVAKEMMEQAGYQVIIHKILPDEQMQLAETMRKICDENLADLILTTGGTGFAPRDCTPEATLEIAQKQVPGLSEAMRAYSMQITPRAMLSRGVSVIRAQTLIVNLPGSPKGVKENLSCILPALRHGLDILTNHTRECASQEEKA